MQLLDIAPLQTRSGGEPQTQNRGFAYLRVSTDPQDENAQRGDIERYCEAHGLEVVEWFADHGLSAYREGVDRPEFERMVAEAKERRDIGFVIVHNFSRFDRQLGRAFAVKADLRHHAVRVLSAKEAIDESQAVAPLLEGVHHGYAAMESLVNRDRTITAMKHHAQQRDPETGWCYKCGGRAPWGYVNVRVVRGKTRKGEDRTRCLWELDRRVVAGRESWRWCRSMLKWRRRGMGYDQIRARLNDAGVPSPHGGLWSAGTLAAMFEPHRIAEYAGEGVWNRGDKKHHRPRSLKDVSEWVRVERAHPRMIAESVARMLLEQRRARPETKIPGSSVRYLLSGILRCSHCGSGYVATRHWRTKGATYLCGGYQSRGHHACAAPRFSLPVSHTDDWFMQLAAKGLRFNRRQLERIAAGYNERTRSLRGDEATIRAELAHLERREREVADSLAAGVPASTVALAAQRIAEQRVNAQARLESARRTQLVELTADDIAETVRNAREILRDEALGVQQRRALLSAFVRTVDVDPQNQRLTVRFADEVSMEVVAPRGFEPLSPP